MEKYTMLNKSRRQSTKSNRDVEGLVNRMVKDC
jgi:hypothetical protein